MDTLDTILKSTEDISENITPITNNDQNSDEPRPDMVNEKLKETDSKFEKTVKEKVKVALGGSTLLAFFVASFKDQILDLLRFLIELITTL